MSERCPRTPGKRAYATRDAAENAAQTFGSHYGRRYQPYPCTGDDGCGLWHVRDMAKRSLKKAAKLAPEKRAAKKKRHRENLRENNPEKHREVRAAAKRRYRANVKARESLSVQGQGCT